MPRKTSESPSVRAQSHPLVRELRFTLAIFLIGAGLLMLLEGLNMVEEQHSLEANIAMVHASAPEMGDADVTVTMLDDVELAVEPGQQDARLMSFLLTSKKAAKVQRLHFSLGELADAAELTSLRLHADGAFVAERAFFEGKGAFDDLHLRLHPGTPVLVDVLGQMSDDAQPGHRLRVGFADNEAVDVKSIVSEPLETSLEFPVWGPAVSVIGRVQ